jgi:hypothetical protein
VSRPAGLEDPTFEDYALGDRLSLPVGRTRQVRFHFIASIRAPANLPFTVTVTEYIAAGARAVIPRSTEARVDVVRKRPPFPPRPSPDFV